MTTKVSDLYDVREANMEEERETILKLWRDIPRDDITNQKKMDWFFLHNPIGACVAYFLIFVPENRPVGVICASRREFQFGEKMYSGAVLCDFVVERAHRSLGPGLFFQNGFAELASKRFDLWYGFPGYRSTRLREYGRRQIRNSLPVLKFPLRFADQLQRHLPRWMAVPIGTALGGAINVVFRLRTRRHISSFHRVELDAAFIDELWRRLKIPEYALGVRDSHYIRWRIFSDPFNDYSLFGIRDTKGRAAGYVICRAGEGGAINIFDYLCACDESFVALIAHLIRLESGGTGQFVSIRVSNSDSQKVRILKKLGFFRRENTNCFLTVGQSAKDEIEASQVFTNLIDNDV